MVIAPSTIVSSPEQVASLSQDCDNYVFSQIYAPPAQGGGWGKREGRFMIPQGLNYLELCKTILSQVGPPAPPQKRASTRECGVQVNARVEKIVQCSLGPKTLLGEEQPEQEPPQSPDAQEGKGDVHSPPVSGLRFLRPVSIYSPLFDRRIFLKKLRDSCEGDAEAPPAKCDTTEYSGEDAEKDFSSSSSYRPLKGSNFQVWRSKPLDFIWFQITALFEKDTPPKIFFSHRCRLYFPFLEQRYGFFHCKKCNIRWESAYVWCISGTSKVYYKQLCRKCQEGFNPYRVESILCKTCCICEKKQRHINMKRPHRQDLCCRCKGMRLSCDAIYSFKYII
uniref:Zygote arrest 1-like n=1 Tax=Oryzias latipes TaxID=8090 RepID=A0A3P9KYB8_ORYLA